MACGVVSQQKKGQEVLSGTPTDPRAQTRAFPGRNSCHAGVEGGAICLTNPLWRTTKSGWSGEAASLTYQTGGKSWWPSLMLLTTADSPQKVQASFEIPWVRCKALKVSNDYSMPPAPKCIGRKAFLPIPDPRMPCQDYSEGQPEKTLAYSQALQY